MDSYFHKLVNVIMLSAHVLCLSGGSCYIQKPWLMTPVEDPQTPAELRYNSSHAAALRVVSKAFCSLKSRFRCLARHGGSLQYSPVKVSQIFIACCVLHNMALGFSIDIPVDAREADSEGEAGKEGNEAAQLARKTLLERHFS